MKAIKEYVSYEDGTYRVIVREKSYDNDFSIILGLVNVAREDFSIEDWEIEVVRYAGERYAHTYGIEFLTWQKPSTDYQEINTTEYRY